MERIIKETLLNCTSIKERKRMFNRAYNLAQIEYGKTDEELLRIIKLYIEGYMELEDVIQKCISYIEATYSNNNSKKTYPFNANKLGIVSQKKLKMASCAIVTLRLMELDLIFDASNINYDKYKECHEFLYSDIYDWAGEERSISLEKRLEYLNGRTITFLEDDINLNMQEVFKQINALTRETSIDKTMQSIFKKLDRDDWQNMSNEQCCAICARIIGNLWFIHPFIEGNTLLAIFTICKIAEYNEFEFSRKTIREQHDKIDIRRCILLASLQENYDVKYLASVLLLSREKKQNDQQMKKRKDGPRRSIEDFLEEAKREREAAESYEDEENVNGGEEES